MGVESSDLGLFGPNSVIWQVHASSAGWVGGIRALLLQALEPRAMAGVSQFSRFDDDILARFTNTSEFLMTVSYRPKEEAEAAIARVKQIHRQVRGIDKATGRPFSANDPYLLAYVHNCLVDSLLEGYCSLKPKLPTSDRDQYVREMSLLAEMIGADMDDIPLTAVSVRRWLETREGLRLTNESKSAAEALKDMNVPSFAAPLWSVAWNAALAILPDFASTIYGFQLSQSQKVGYLETAKCVSMAMELLLPSHPYFREAKYAYYRSYRQRESGSMISFATSCKDIFRVMTTV